MKKVIVIINRKTGKVTTTCEGGEGGGQCLTDTSPIEQRLGMLNPEREMLPDYYNKVQNKGEQEVGGA